MANYNIMFDGNSDDCDIIAVPDTYAKELEELAQAFCDWLTTDEAHEYWYHDTRYGFIPALETSGFVDWLNKRFNLSKGNVVTIVKQHTILDPIYPIIEF